LLAYVLAFSALIPFPGFLCQPSYCGLLGFDTCRCRHSFENTTASFEQKLWILHLC